MGQQVWHHALIEVTLQRMDQFVVSARKYRPTTFEDVVGQHQVVETLTHEINNNKLAQAFYLLVQEVLEKQRVLGFWPK